MSMALKAILDSGFAPIIFVPILFTILTPQAYTFTNEFFTYTEVLNTVDKDNVPTVFGRVFHTAVLLAVLFFIYRSPYNYPRRNFNLSEILRNVSIFVALSYIFSLFHSRFAYKVTACFIPGSLMNAQNKPTTFGVMLQTFVTLFAINIGYEYVLDALFYMWNVPMSSVDKLMLDSLGVETTFSAQYRRGQPDSVLYTDYFRRLPKLAGYKPLANENDHYYYLTRL